MPKFGKNSKEKRALLCKELRSLVDFVIKEYDFSIIESHRDKTEQERCFNIGVSKAHFGESAHNYNPSFAVDVYPYPVPKTVSKGIVNIDNDSPEWDNMINIFKKAAKELKIDIVCGIDFKTLRDAPHIEIKDWKKRVKDI